MSLMVITSYDEDIKFQSSDRPQFLTLQMPTGASQSTRFCWQRNAIATIAEKLILSRGELFVPIGTPEVEGFGGTARAVEAKQLYAICTTLPQRQGRTQQPFAIAM